MDHVAVRSIHEEADMSSQGRAAVPCSLDGGGVHAVAPVNGPAMVHDVVFNGCEE
jgi:hypothetical protein